MEGLAALSTPTNSNLYSATPASLNDSLDGLILEKTLGGDDDSVSVDLGTDDLYQSLSLSSQKIIDKLNELLKAKLPDGIQSLNPDDYTAEKTADRIVSSITALFDNYVKSNPQLSADEAIKRFVAAAKSGVDAGYSDAYDTLKGLGAFEVDGVQSGVEETRRLIDEKFANFEAQKRKELGLDNADPKDAAADITKNELLQSSGSKLVSSISVVA